MTRSSPETTVPPVNLADRIALYLEDMPSDGQHSDVAGADCWELLREAMDELRTPAQAPTKQDFIRLGISTFKEHELREIVAVFCKLPGIAPAQPQTPPAQPVAWLVPSDETGFCRIWWRDKERAEAWLAKHPNCTLVPLYAAPPAARCSEGIAEANLVRLSASEVACYRWPEDTSEHRAMRAAFMDGAASTHPSQHQQGE